MRMTNVSGPAFAVTLAIALTVAFAGAAAAQDEILFDNCEDRLFRYSDVAGYSCKGFVELLSFEDECVCFARNLVTVEGPGSLTFMQFRANDPGCSRAPLETGGLAFENVCACQPVGAHLRRSSSYLCTPTGSFTAESPPGGYVAFNGANSGDVRLLGRSIWPGNGLNVSTVPPMASVFACKRDRSCQEACEQCAAPVAQ